MTSIGLPIGLCVAAAALLIAQRFGGTRARLASPRAVMPMLISIVLLAASLYVILSGRYDAGSQRWAFATVGSIVGYWLRK